MIRFEACQRSLVCLLGFTSILVSTSWIRETASAHIPVADCKSARINARELSPSFCPDAHSVALWKTCPHATSQLCVEGFLSVPSVGSDKRLQLRRRKKGLRSNEIFRIRRSSEVTNDGKHPFYMLTTAEGRCVEINESGHLIASTKSSSCETLFRDFIPSSSVLAASPRRICALHHSRETLDRAYVLRFNEHGQQTPLPLQNPVNCTRVLSSTKPVCENSSDIELGGLLGLTRDDLQTTAFRLFSGLQNSTRMGVNGNNSCHSILSNEIQDCCGLREQCL